MPLIKKAANGSTTTEIPPAVEALKTEAPKTQVLAGRHTREMPMTKDDYWRRREERDIQKEDRQVQRDKDMAWSGLAQAALGSVSVAQLNTDNTEDGLVSLVSRIVDKLLKVRDSR